jgi:uncharacterized protein (TIGR03663 family)
MTQEVLSRMAEDRRAQLLGLGLFILALVFGAWLRFAQIGIKPFHHDESVNAHFLLRLAHEGQYVYDPSNYHGPTLYYFALIAVRVFGETDLALRLWPAIFGLLTVGLLWGLRRELGMIGIGVSGMLIAFSPGLVYFSRDFIHEILFGCFTVGIVVGAWRYAATKRFAPLALAVSSAALLFATKETAIITVVVLILAALFAAIWDIARRKGFGAVVGELSGELRRLTPTRDHLLAAVVIFIFIFVLFYSSFFTHISGVRDAFLSVIQWTTERSGKDHVHDFNYYLGILLKIELPLLLGGLIAGAVILWRGTRFGLFLGAWALGITLAYSLIPYKTPWLIVSALIPLAMAIGYAVDELARLLTGLTPQIVLAAACLVAFILSWQMASRINFDKYDDNGNESGYFVEFGKKRGWRPYVDGQYGYVYAQTDRQLLELVQKVEEEVEKQPTGDKTGVYLASPAHWPLPWYLRRYNGVAYTGNLSGQITQPLLIANLTQRDEVEQLGGWRAVTSPLTLRPGEQLILYVRQ